MAPVRNVSVLSSINSKHAFLPIGSKMMYERMAKEHHYSTILYSSKKTETRRSVMLIRSTYSTLPVVLWWEVTGGRIYGGPKRCAVRPSSNLPPQKLSPFCCWCLPRSTTSALFFHRPLFQFAFSLFKTDKK